MSLLVRGLLRLSPCELLLLEVGSRGKGELGTAEEEERPPLEAVTRKLSKTLQAEKTVCVVVN
jgi:hypothetical protein